MLSHVYHADRRLFLYYFLGLCLILLLYIVHFFYRFFLIFPDPHCEIGFRFQYMFRFYF